MESRLKERLTGAAILVALIVLVVPEMFHGPSNAGPAGPTAAAEGPPVRSYTIDLTDSTAHPAPLEATTSATHGAAVGPQASTGPPAAPSGAAAGASAGLTVSTTAPAIAAAPELPAVHARTAAPAREVRGRPARAGRPATAAKVSAVVTTPAGTAPAGWSVQLGLFAKDGNAQRLMLSARGKGFSTRISRTEPKGLYRVWIAGLADRSAAEQMSRKLHAAGLPAAIIRVR